MNTRAFNYVALAAVALATIMTIAFVVRMGGETRPSACAAPLGQCIVLTLRDGQSVLACPIGRPRHA